MRVLENTPLQGVVPFLQERILAVHCKSVCVCVCVCVCVWSMVPIRVCSCVSPGQICEHICGCDWVSGGVFLPLSLFILPLTHLSKAELKIPLLSPRTQAPRQDSPGLLFSEPLLALWGCLPAPGPRKAAHHVLLSTPRVHSSPLSPFPAIPLPDHSLVLAPRNLSMVTPPKLKHGHCCPLQVSDGNRWGPTEPPNASWACLSVSSPTREGGPSEVAVVREDRELSHILNSLRERSQARLLAALIPDILALFLSLPKTNSSCRDGKREAKGSVKSVLNIHWKDWGWSWNSNTLATWCEEPAHWKKPWYWERLKVGGEGDDRGWDGWMAPPTWWTWVWASSGRWTGKPGML